MCQRVVKPTFRTVDLNRVVQLLWKRDAEDANARNAFVTLTPGVAIFLGTIPVWGFVLKNVVRTVDPPLKRL